MESFLIYIIKMAGLISVFFGAYHLLLRKEVDFQLNRKFLISGIFISAILPGIYITKKIFIEPVSIPNMEAYSAGNIPTIIPVENTIDWWYIAGIIYLSITSLFLARFIMQLLSVGKIIMSAPAKQSSGFNYIQIEDEQLPFSFFKNIVYNPEIHSAKDLRLILQHEKVHASQYHSIDVLLVNLTSCLLWFNPLSWLYKKAIEQNLEFIADRETVQGKEDIKEYQHALVKVSIADLKPALTNHFYKSFIKKRILMLNNRNNKKSSSWRIGLVVPFLIAFIFLLNVKTEAHVIDSEILQTPPSSTETEVSVIITKTTTEESLESIKSFFKKREIEVSYSDLSIKDGNIVSIDFSFLDNKTGNKGNIYRSNENGIEGFEFYRNNESIGFRKVNQTPETKASAHTIRTVHLNKLQEDPLYIINGKQYSSRKLKNKYIKYSNSIQSLSPEEAVDQFGKPAKNGAVIIPDGKIIKDFDKELKDKSEKFSAKYILVTKNGMPNFMDIERFKTPKSDLKYIGSTEASDDQFQIVKARKLNNNSTINSKDNKSVYSFSMNGNIKKTEADKAPKASGMKATYKAENIRIIADSTEKPIFIINGQIKGESFNTSSIDPSEIHEVYVLKGYSATEKYGDKANSGAIEIITKGYHSNKDELFKIEANMDDEELEAVKKMFQEKTGILMEISNVSRNNDKINSISIVNKLNGKQVGTAQFSDTNGIPTIYVGIKNGDPVISSSVK